MSGNGRVRNNPQLGTVTCNTCGQQATVHQQQRGKGRYLYLRGCECKYVNSTGKTFQTYLWKNSTWLPEAQPVKPANVDDDGPPDYDPNPTPASSSSPASDAPRGAAGNPPGEPTPPPAPESTDSAGGGGRKVAGLVALLAAVGAVIVSLVAR